MISETIITNLKNRGFNVIVCSSKQEAKEKALDLIKENSSIGWGGSQSLVQTGILEALKQNKDKLNLELIDRSEAKDKDELRKIFLRCFEADYFLTSANALTEEGMIVNIDGRGNRVAPAIYGARDIIYIIGNNKIVKGGIENAINRVKNIASPPNAKRLGLETTGCYITGKCTDCSSDQRMCRFISITEYAKYQGEGSMTVILVDEELGY